MFVLEEFKKMCFCAKLGTPAPHEEERCTENDWEAESLITLITAYNLHLIARADAFYVMLDLVIFRNALLLGPCCRYWNIKNNNAAVTK